MADPEKAKYFRVQGTFRTNYACMAALKNAIAALAAEGSLSLPGQSMITQEALINVSWVWMSQVVNEKGAKELARILRPALDEVSRGIEGGIVAWEQREERKKANKKKIRDRDSARERRASKKQSEEKSNNPHSEN